MAQTPEHHKLQEVLGDRLSSSPSTNTSSTDRSKLAKACQFEDGDNVNARPKNYSFLTENFDFYKLTKARTFLFLSSFSHLSEQQVEQRQQFSRELMSFRKEFLNVIRVAVFELITVRCLYQPVFHTLVSCGDAAETLQGKLQCFCPTTETQHSCCGPYP